jgi:hypothetical protein
MSGTYVRVTGNVLSFIGSQLGKRNTFNSGTVRFMLVLPPQASPPVAVDASNGQPARVHYDVAVHWDGSFNAELLPNDAISPPGTTYSVMLMVPNINVVPKFYSFNGPGPFNLNTMTPTTDDEVKARRASAIGDRIASLRKQLEDLA